MATYDSAKTRRVAREMTQLRQTLEMDVDAGLRGALPLIAELRGKTAQAMEEALEDLVRAERALGDEFEALAHSVNAYADRLEQADDWLAKRM